MASFGRVLVVGAAGSVGRQLVDMLPSRGWSVRAVDRPGAWSGPPREGTALEVLAGDIRSEAFLGEVMADVQAVVWASDAAQDAETARAVNAEAAEACYLAARRAGVQVFVYVSCGLVYGRSGKPLAEGTRPAPSSAYARSKWEGERALREALARSGTALVVLRTGPVFGPGARGVGGLVAAAAVLGHALFGGRFRFRGGPVWTWSHAGDVARAAFHAIRSQGLWGGTFNVVSGGPISLGRVLGLASEGYAGRPRRGLPLVLPTSRLFRWLRAVGTERLSREAGPLLAWVWSFLGREAERHLVPEPGPGLWDLLGRELVLDGTALERKGFLSEHTDPARSWRQVMNWYVRQGWLPSPAATGPSPSLVASELSLRGEHAPVGQPAASEPLNAHLRFHWQGGRDFLTRWTLGVDGSFFLQGLAEHVSCWGDLELQPWRRKVILELHLRLEGTREGFLRLHGLLDKESLLRGLELSGGLFEEGGRMLRTVRARLGLPERLAGLVPSVLVTRRVPTPG